MNKKNKKEKQSEYDRVLDSLIVEYLDNQRSTNKEQGIDSYKDLDLESLVDFCGLDRNLEQDLEIVLKKLRYFSGVVEHIPSLDEQGKNVDAKNNK